MSAPSVDSGSPVGDNISLGSTAPAMPSLGMENFGQLSLAEITTVLRREGFLRADGTAQPDRLPALTLWADEQNDKGLSRLALILEEHTDPNFKPKIPPEKIPTSKMDVLAFLLEVCKADLNKVDNNKDRWPPLYRAATGTRMDALEYMLRNGADPDIKNSDGSAPIHRAAGRCNLDDIRLLVEVGHADVNSVNVLGTVLFYAARSGRGDIVEFLLHNQADPNLIIDPLEPTPLGVSKDGHVNFLLFQSGGQLEIRNDSPVHNDTLSLLVLSGNRDAILASFRANETDKFGRTVAHYCARWGHTDLLREMRTGIDVADSKGRTPLHYAIMKGHTETTIFMINEANCSLASQDDQKYHPLTWACQYGRTGIATAILARADNEGKLQNILDLTDKFGWKAIHKAAEAGSLDIVKLLVEVYHVDPTEPLKEKEQRTPLTLAESTGATAVVDYLTPKPLPPGATKG